MESLPYFFNSWVWIKKILYCYILVVEKKKVELDFSSYATKLYLKNATGVDTSKFVRNHDLASLKPDVDELDIDKLKSVSSGLES